MPECQVMSEGLTNPIAVSALLVKLLERDEEDGNIASKRALKAARRLHQQISARAIEPILDMIPGTPLERAKKLGVSRQSYYGWLWGRQRPDGKQAKKIARLTGVPVNEIRGLEAGK